MARVITCGWESGGASEGATLTGTPTADATIKRTGSYSLKLNTGSPAVSQMAGYATGVVSNANGAYARVWFRFPAAPTANVVIVDIGGSATTAFGTGPHLKTDRTIQMGLIGSLAGSASAALAVDTWHLLEYFFKIGTGATDQFTLKVNGATVYTATTDNVTDNPTTHVLLRAPSTAGTNWIVYFDDLKINTDAGSSETSWPNAGELALLLPVAESSDGSWTKPGGGTTNTYTSVDNVPPIGVADTTSSGNAENQLRNPTANDAYAVALRDYTTAGVSGALDGLHPIAVVAAPASTGAKTGSLEGVSNPAITALSFGNYHSGTNAGTFPTGWKYVYGTYSAAPSVTLGTQPVVRLNITGGTTSRIAMACFVGMYVEYTAGSSEINGTATGSFAVTGTAEGTSPRNAAASGTIALAGTGTATVLNTATASGSFAITGASTAAVKVSGDSSGSLAFTGSADGTVVWTPITGTASGSFDLTGAATGTIAIAAAGAGSFAITGTATAIVPAQGTATGSLAITGSATAVAPVQATASGSFSLTGAGTAVVQVQGAASGSFSPMGTAAGAVLNTGAASGEFAISGAAAGTIPVVGTAAGDLAISGTAAGQVPLLATAAGSLTLSGAATGAVANTGQAAGDLALTGSATGSGQVATGGAAEGSIAFTGTATAAVAVKGIVSGDLGLTGSVSGASAIQGGASGSLPLSGASTGEVVSNTREGAAAGSIGLTGSAAGTVANHGAAAGVVSITGSAIGSVPAQGTASGSISFTGAATGNFERIRRPTVPRPGLQSSPSRPLQTFTARQPTITGTRPAQASSTRPRAVSSGRR